MRLLNEFLDVLIALLVYRSVYGWDQAWVLGRRCCVCRRRFRWASHVCKFRRGRHLLLWHPHCREGVEMASALAGERWSAE